MATAKSKERSYAVSIDSKGRVTVPAEIRKALKLNEGDVLYFRVTPRGMGVFKKAIDPFAVIRDDALRQSRQGKTTSFDSLVAELGVNGIEDVNET